MNTNETLVKTTQINAQERGSDTEIEPYNDERDHIGDNKTNNQIDN